MFALPGGVRALEEKVLAEAAVDWLRPAVQAFALDEAPASHQALESRATMGKLVLIPR
ncbi:hypothetical protein [Streptomyces lunaelactis]|uniref:hypothetical protein n=1 Tax=Streptomyces lunaelactis TaxID=1535768 RepID=UPI00131EFDBB|nr:hypothetical protein [Streptomyces lunaelactis]NUK27502.1 hypothetical protein [Streptomyces lunaelactis]NUK85962.1 hypothetical protein [Streptomyces lunaelactis]